MNTEQESLLEDWRQELSYLQQSHYAKSISTLRLHYLLGIPTILISILITAYVLFTLLYNPIFWVKVAAAMLLLLSTILTLLQTFLKYSEQAEHHRTASVRYESLHNSVDQMLVFPPNEDEMLNKWCYKLRKRWDELNLEAPKVNKQENSLNNNNSTAKPINKSTKIQKQTIKSSTSVIEKDEFGYDVEIEKNKQVHREI